MKKTKEKTKDFFHYLKIIIAILLIFIIILLTIFGYRFGKALFTDKGVAAPGEGVEYVLNVAPGESTFTVGRDLESHGIVDSALAFWVQSKLFKCSIAPGSYKVNSATSSKAILKDLNAQRTKNK